MFVEPPSSLPFFLVNRAIGKAMTVSPITNVNHISFEPLNYSDSQKFVYVPEKKGLIKAFSAEKVLKTENGSNKDGVELVFQESTGDQTEQWHLNGEEIYSNINGKVVTLELSDEKVKTTMKEQNNSDFQAFDIIFA